RARHALAVMGRSLSGTTSYARQVAPWFACAPSARNAIDTAGAVASRHPEQEPLQAALLRDIAGNPFRPPLLDPRWRTPDVVQLARAAEVHGSFDALPVVADALEEAGCTNRDVLAHLRGPGPHVRGCWALGLILTAG